jgi:hypothetical protein
MCRTTNGTITNVVARKRDQAAFMYRKKEPFCE